MHDGRMNWLTAAAWFVVGAGLGGLFGLQALSSGSPLVAVPAGIGALLLLRAWRRRVTRAWADLAAFLLGAGALALAFAVPAMLNPMCVGDGRGATGATDCTVNYEAVAVAALYAACLLTGSALVARLTRHAEPPPALAARPLS